MPAWLPALALLFVLAPLSVWLLWRNPK
jgi:hypothetical protein